MSEKQYQTHPYSSWLHFWIYSHAHPSYECELCVGQEWWRGCECAYHEAIAPGVGPTRWHLLLRWIWDHRA